jgi:hypothetical protein
MLLLKGPPRVWPLACLTEVGINLQEAPVAGASTAFLVRLGTSGFDAHLM